MSYENEMLKKIEQTIKEARNELNTIAEKLNKPLGMKFSIEFVYYSSVLAAWLEDLIDLSNISLIDLLDKKNLDILEKCIKDNMVKTLENKNTTKDNINQLEGYNTALTCLADMKENLERINRINSSLQKENNIAIPKRVLYDKFLCDFIAQMLGYNSFLYLYNWHDNESKPDYIDKELRITNSVQSIKLNQDVYNFLVVFANNYLKDSSDITNIESYIINNK